VPSLQRAVAPIGRASAEFTVVFAAIPADAAFVWRGGGPFGTGGAATFDGAFACSARSRAARAESGGGLTRFIGSTVAGVATRCAAVRGRGGVGAGDEAGFGSNGGPFEATGAGGGGGALDCARAAGTMNAAAAIATAARHATPLILRFTRVSLIMAP
jgi:hypothetical protein